MRPPRFGPRPRTTDLRRRVVYLEEDVGGMQSLQWMLIEDVTGLLQERSPRDRQASLVVNALATVIAIMGARPTTLMAWVTAVIEDGDSEFAEEVTSQLIEELVLMHGGQAGEA